MEYSMLCSEKTKLFSFGWCLLGIAGAILIPPIVLFLSDAPIGNTENEIVVTILKKLYLGQLGVAVIGATYFGQEYSNSTLRTTLLAVPARLKLLCAKTILLVIVVISTCNISSILCLIIVSFQNNIELTLSLIKNLLINTLLVTCSWLHLAWISASLSVIMKSFAVPVAIMISLILGLSEMIFSVLEIIKYTPVLATMNLFLLSTNPIFLGKSLGLLIQFFWGGIFATIAALSFSHRDVH